MITISETDIVKLMKNGLTAHEACEILIDMEA